MTALRRRRILADMRNGLGTCVLVCWVAVAEPAWAAPPADQPMDKTQAAVEVAQQARAKFAAKDYRAAAQLFMDAYAKVPEAPLLFNAARSYEELGELKEALPLFQLYLSVESETEVAGRRDAQFRIARIEAALRAPATAAKPETPPPAQVPVAAPLPEQTEAVARQPAPAPISREPPTRVWRNRAPWLVAGGGVALLVVGAVVRATAGATLDDLDARLAQDAPPMAATTFHPGVTQRQLADAIAARDTQRTAGGLLVGTGMAAVAVGATLWWLADKPSWAQVQPWYGSGAAGVALAGAF